MTQRGESLLRRVEESLDIFLSTRPRMAWQTQPDSASAAAKASIQDPAYLDRLARSLHQVTSLLTDISKLPASPSPTQEGPRSPAPPESESESESESEVSFAQLLGLEEDPLVTLCALIQKSLLNGIDGLRLARLAGDPKKIFGLAESSWHEALRGLIGIEAALLEQQGLPQRPRTEVFLEESLQVRHLFGALRLVVLADGRPEASELAGRLQVAARYLESMQGLAVFQHLRPQDRFQIETQTERLQTWLGGSSASAEGQRIWQDLAGFVQLLRQVNLREELVQHDREVLDRLRATLEASEAPDGRVPMEVRQILQALFGRDERLDLLLERPLGFGLAELFEIFPFLQPQSQLA